MGSPSQASRSALKRTSLEIWSIPLKSVFPSGDLSCFTDLEIFHTILRAYRWNVFIARYIEKSIAMDYNYCIKLKTPRKEPRFFFVFLKPDQIDGSSISRYVSSGALLKASKKSSKTTLKYFDFPYHNVNVKFFLSLEPMLSLCKEFKTKDDGGSLRIFCISPTRCFASQSRLDSFPTLSNTITAFSTVKSPFFCRALKAFLSIRECTTACNAVRARYFATTHAVSHSPIAEKIGIWYDALNGSTSNCNVLVLAVLPLVSSTIQLPGGFFPSQDF